MRERGFSFMEILVALLLVTSISLALLKQQWQMNRLRMQVEQKHVQWLKSVNQHERGLTLLECLLGLTFSLLLLTLVMQQYLHIKQQTAEAVRTMSQMSRLHLVVDMVRHRGHQAGFSPCLPIQTLKSYDSVTHNALQAFELQKLPSFKIIFYRMSDDYVQIAPTAQVRTFALLGNWRPHPNHALIIADCQHAEVIHSYHINADEIEWLKALRFAYHPPIYLGEWMTESFWVAAKPHEHAALLYMQAQHVETLLPDVYALQGYMAMHNHHAVLHLNMDIGMHDPIKIAIRMSHL